MPTFISLAYITANQKGELWHKRLGHPNYVVLSHLLNSGLLGNKDQFSSHFLLTALHVNWVKVSLFLFLPMVVLQKAILI